MMKARHPLCVVVQVGYRRGSPLYKTITDCDGVVCKQQWYYVVCVTDIHYVMMASCSMRRQQSMHGLAGRCRVYVR